MSVLRTKSRGVVLIAQILSERVSFASVDITGEVPVVLLAQHAELPAAERTREQGSQQLIALVGERCVAFVDAYSKSDGSRECGPISSIEVHLGAAFAEAGTATYTAKFAETQTVTDSLIASAAEKALSLLPKTDRIVIESHVMRVCVNGYSTAKPVGKSGTSITVTVFQSTAEAPIRTRLEQVLNQALPGQPLLWRSFARDLMSVLRAHAPSRHHLIISMEGTASHCVSLRGDEIASHASVNFGTGHIFEQLAGNGSLEETRTLVRLAGKDACSTPACEAIRAKLAATEPLIVKTFGDEFASLSQVYRLPNNCLILGDADMAPWFEHVFSRLDFAQFTITSQPLEVSPFQITVRGLVKSENAYVGTELETAIAATALYTKQG
jgi:hypothetical protein